MPQYVFVSVQSNVFVDVNVALSPPVIDDACQLAMADPYRLIRNTTFDKRQILHFLDCALLMMHLPEAFGALDRRGVTGAMGLVWYVREPSRGKALEALAADVRLDPVNLRSIAEQLAADKQLNLVRLLYLLERDGGAPARRPPPPHPDGSLAPAE